MSEKTFITKDSGARRDFGTGSVRDRSTGKGRFDLIPPILLRRLAGLYERGAEKYGDNNWQKGQPLMASFADSAMRHLSQLIGGEPTEDHAASVVWNMAGFMWTLAEIEAGRLPKFLDDRRPPEPHYLPKPEPKAETEAPFVEAWRKGGCVVCGAADRRGTDDGKPGGERAYAHDHCWKAADRDGRIGEFIDACGRE